MEIQLLTQPLSTSEIKKLSKNGKNKITVQVTVDTEEMIQNDFESFLDIISERVHESGLLENFSYTPVGMTETKQVIFEVTGYVNSILENE